MSSQDSDTEFLVDAVNQMDHEEEEEDHFLAGAINAMDQEEEDNDDDDDDEFLASVPYVPPPAAVPHIDPNDPLLLIPAEDPDEMLLQIMTLLHHHNKLVRNHTQISTSSLTGMTSITTWETFAQGK